MADDSGGIRAKIIDWFAFQRPRRGDNLGDGTSEMICLSLSRSFRTKLFFSDRRRPVSVTSKNDFGSTSSSLSRAFHGVVFSMGGYVNTFLASWRCSGQKGYYHTCYDRTRGRSLSLRIVPLIMFVSSRFVPTTLCAVKYLCRLETENSCCKTNAYTTLPDCICPLID